VRLSVDIGVHKQANPPNTHVGRNIKCQPFLMCPSWSS